MFKKKEFGVKLVFLLYCGFPESSLGRSILCMFQKLYLKGLRVGLSWKNVYLARDEAMGLVPSTT